MKKQPHTKQHYIPQCYFRNFSSNNNSIYVYDKSLSNSFLTAIGKICCEDEYYSILAKNVTVFDTSREKELIIEKGIFADNIEPQYNILLNKIIARKDEWLMNYSKSIAVSDDKKKELAFLIAIQFLRMPNMRDLLMELHEGKCMKDIHKFFKQAITIETGNQAFNDLKIDPKVEDPALLHVQSIFGNSGVLEEFTTVLYNKYWEFTVSKDNDILTSDNPIVVKAHNAEVKELYQGLGSASTEISFPLSKNIILVIWDKNYFPSKKVVDCNFTLLTDKKKREYNCLRYACSKSRVFGYNSDFSLIDSIKAVNNGREVSYNYCVG